MTNTEFIARETSRPPARMAFGAVDVAMLLGFVVAFLGLVLLLSK
jgi:hypothetical protein